jgi:hypothetical protein
LPPRQPLPPALSIFQPAWPQTATKKPSPASQPEPPLLPRPLAQSAASKTGLESPAGFRQGPIPQPQPRTKPTPGVRTPLQAPPQPPRPSPAERTAHLPILRSTQLSHSPRLRKDRQPPARSPPDHLPRSRRTQPQSSPSRSAQPIPAPAPSSPPPQPPAPGPIAPQNQRASQPRVRQRPTSMPPSRPGSPSKPHTLSLNPRRINRLQQKPHSRTPFAPSIRAALTLPGPVPEPTRPRPAITTRNSDGLPSGPMPTAQASTPP